MEKLCYETLENIGYEGYLLRDAPERVLQFGEGNFLRAFADYFVDVMNEKAGFHGKVVLVQPIAPGMASVLNGQEGLYTLLLRGRENGQKVCRKRVISSVSRCLNPYEDFGALLDCAKNPDLRFIISNTTEAGIVYDPLCQLDDAPPSSFPAKLTRFLYERWRLGLPGFLVLSCELIDCNGAQLRKCVEQYVAQWGLPEEFSRWVTTENRICSTLVDRIVTGYPRSEAEELWAALGYRDDALDTGEVFGFWVIEGPQSIREELPFAAAGLPILVTDDHTPYKQRKVRILNGAHTAMIMAAYLAGEDIVRGCMEDDTLRGFMNKTIYEEVIPTLDLPLEELTEFAAAVTQRFQNPYIDHALLAISLNSTAKWRARVMPSLLEYEKRKKKLPPCITFSFAAYLAFYHRGQRRGAHCLVGMRGETPYEIQDDDWVLDFFYDHRGDDAGTLAAAVIGNERMWGDALKKLPGFADAVTAALERMERVGMREAL
ncbi:MAG: tagaturonate reductase, partial [Oscillospiraceae bacterium]